MTARSRSINSNAADPPWLLNGVEAPKVYTRLAQDAIRANAVNSVIVEGKQTSQGGANQTTRILAQPITDAAAAQSVAVALSTALARAARCSTNCSTPSRRRCCSPTPWARTPPTRRCCGAPSTTGSSIPTARSRVCGHHVDPPRPQRDADEAHGSVGAADGAAVCARRSSPSAASRRAWATRAATCSGHLQLHRQPRRLRARRRVVVVGAHRLPRLAPVGPRDAARNVADRRGLPGGGDL